MTREEARKTIHDFMGWFKKDKPMYEALDMAIKALSAEPCREADDYENEIADLQNRLDIAEYDRDRWKEIVTVLEEKLKSLSAEPCEECISRQAALDVIAETDITNGTEPVFTGKQVQALLRDLPLVTPKQKMGRWIPVNERLPEVKYDSLGNNISDYVLLWVKKGDYETYKIGYFSPPNCFDAITSDGWFISVCALKDVIAWMPLPVPYMAESEVTQDADSN